MSLDSEDLTYKIAYLSRLHKRKIDQDTLKYGLTAEQGRLILFLSENKEKPVYMKDLEKSFNLRKSSLNSLINNLEKNGCVVRLINKDDLRLKELKLTKLGEEKVQLLRKSFKDNESSTRDALTFEEAKILNDILDKLITNIKKN